MLAHPVEVGRLRYVLFVVGVCSCFVLPAPLHGYYDVNGVPTIVHDIVAIAALVVVTMVLGGSLVSLILPRATFWLFTAAGCIGVLVGVGTLQPFMIASGVWVLFLAGLSYLGLRLSHRRRSGVSKHHQPHQMGLST